jgi:hypothetical protein
MKIDTILDDYLVCALWSSTDENGEPMDTAHGLTEISDEFRAQARADIADFIVSNPTDTAAFCDRHGDGQLGHSFWLSRNGHGAGFFDWSGSMYTRLQDAARVYGSRDLYTGDDGKVYAQ